ncbi:glycosyltransferase [Luteitalea sp.]|jgi:glycosyltransferase involved in cell wall biosynthesis|uniref:glycosyltransferase n=1 Tax=Luteitalea sp. TaxID=2004800 RepID=UPI0037CAA6B6
MAIRTIHIDTARTWRGGQNQALLTVKGLRALGHPTMLVAHPEGELRRRAPQDPDLVPLAPRFEVDFHAAWKLARIIRAFNPALLHAHDPHGVALAALALGFRMPWPPPMLVASRRVDFRLAGNSLSRAKYRQVDRFICASAAIGRILAADRVPADRIVTVHEGVDLQHVADAPPVSIHETFWLPHGAPVVLNVAALVPHKGQRYLIDAFASVVRAVPDARLVILGQGELHQALEKQVHHHGLEKHVLLPGFRTDVLSLMKTADIFVMSSVMEGLGTSLLDAMACARPIVATETGGIPEVVAHDETGLLVPPRDAEALADALATLLQDEDRARGYGAAGYERVHRQFSVDHMVRNTVAEYEQLLAARG